ncbi:MAG TPA: ABC transporter ATP-binding protein [Mucilaginibacter sp.]|nr:ABC transporter ATP-binding protein [Mucilaginibacter sp.]
MKQILSGIFSILSSREKVKLGQFILFDLAIGVLDITFLGLLLVIINFYTKNLPAAKIAFLPAVLFSPNSIALIGVFLILFSLKNWAAFLGLKSQHHFFYAVASRLSKRNILSYLTADYSHFVNIDSSVQVRRISHQPVEFSHYILTNFQQVVAQIILIFFTICAILFYHPSLFLLLFLVLLPPVVALAWFIRRKLKSLRANIKAANQRTIQHLNEALSGYVESNIYDKNGFFINRYYSYQEQLNENIATQQTLQSLPSRLIEIFAVLGFFILIVINKWSANMPAVDLLTIGIFMAASYKIIPGVVKILNCTGQMKTYQFTLTDLLPVQADNITNKPRFSHPITSLKFKQVYFKYKDQPVVNHASFELVPGDFAGISGVSGRGKTTLINLLLGFLEPDCGAILLNDKIITTGDRKAYWNRISYVKQQPFFIHDSIIKNITLDDEMYDEAKLSEVIAFCGIDKLLDKYPGGYETTIKENGKNISGGQRQRIMLARALYHDFDLLILDEPFGEMDDQSECGILKQLQLLAQRGKMIIFITHNKNSLSFCNKILSLDEK